jgi:hypothetical protein
VAGFRFLSRDPSAHAFFQNVERQSAVLQDFIVKFAHIEGVSELSF